MIENPNDVVPKIAAKTIGHVCGIIFIAFFTLFLWTSYRIVILQKFNPGIFVLLLIIFSITYFFGRTAVQLTTKENPRIISRYGYKAIILFSGILSLMCAAIVLKSFSDPDFSGIDRIIWMIASIASALFGYLFFLFLKKHNIKI